MLRRVLPLVALAALLAGCGTGGKAVSLAKADKDKGMKLFQSQCGGCHKLAAAGTPGTSGPNLDDAFGGSLKQGFKQSTIQNVVLDQIREAAPPMPKNLVKGQDAQDVAAFVASAAGQGGTKQQQPAGNDGKSIFSANCASCHTLKAAGATGTVGPNLDQLKPAFDVVKHQVEVGGGVMPAFKGTLTDEQIDAVSHYVADNAGK